MTIKEAILKSLEDIGEPATYDVVYSHIVDNQYYDFGPAKTPNQTVAAQLGDFIRKGDSRVKRVKKGRNYSYFLSKLEHEIGIDILTGITESNIVKGEAVATSSYKERDLHLLLSTFLFGNKVLCKTIFHEKSANKKDKHQKWIHPDMIGVKFLTLSTSASQSLLKSVNKTDAFRLNSYELKREINTDYELKEAFFQAVSNSSWSNHGYLVAFEFNDSLFDEMERLSQSFGIGIIELKSNPFESKVLFPAKYSEIDFKTLDKLCKINDEFKEFIVLLEKNISVEDKYSIAIQKEFSDFCDGHLKDDGEIKKYCIDKNIPLEEEYD